MSTIIAAQYDRFDEAAHATNRLRAAGFEEDAIAVFFNNAPGRHATFPLGGDELADPEAHVLSEGAAKGAGADSQARDPDDRPKIWRRPAGVMVAVALPERSREGPALHALRDTGGRNIERAAGTISDGNWIDFDPLTSPKLVDEAQHSTAES